MVQLELLKYIVKTMLSDLSNVNDFNNRKVNHIRLSTLKKYYDEKDTHILALLSLHQAIHMDSRFCLKLRTRQISMDTSTTMLNFQLTVAN